MEKEAIEAHNEAMNGAIRQLLVQAGQPVDESRNYSDEHNKGTLDSYLTGVAQMAAVLLIRRNDEAATKRRKEMKKFM